MNGIFGQRALSTEFTVMIVAFGLNSVRLIFQCLSFSGCALAAINCTGRHTRTAASEDVKSYGLCANGMNGICHNMIKSYQAIPHWNRTSPDITGLRELPSYILLPCGCNSDTPPWRKHLRQHQKWSEQSHWVDVVSWLQGAFSTAPRLGPQNSMRMEF